MKRDPQKLRAWKQRSKPLLPKGWHLTGKKQKAITAKNWDELREKVVAWRKRRGRPMRRQSPKRQREQKIYTKENRAFKAAHPICQIQVMCKGAPTQVVCHTKGRGIYYLDKKTWKAGCWPCENWLTTHGKQAIKMGLHQDRIGHD